MTTEQTTEQQRREYLASLGLTFSADYNGVDVSTETGVGTKTTEHRGGPRVSSQGADAGGVDSSLWNTALFLHSMEE